MPYGITQCYLPPDRGENPTFTPSQSRYSISRPERDARLSCESGLAGIWTCDLSVANPTPYYTANMQQCSLLSWEDIQFQSKWRKTASITNEYRFRRFFIISVTCTASVPGWFTLQITASVPSRFTLQITASVPGRFTLQITAYRWGLHCKSRHGTRVFVCSTQCCM